MADSEGATGHRTADARPGGGSPAADAVGVMNAWQAHPAPARRFSCPGCQTCSEARRRERVWAALVLAVFVVVFVVPTMGWWGL